MDTAEKNSTDLSAYYDRRYTEDNYMDEWPAAKKQRILEVIKSLDLPQTGKALDFGCGNGVFTSVLKQALPGWEIYGCEISQMAVANAIRRFPGIEFFVIGSRRDLPKFDLLFTHHVLEHVADLEQAGREINGYLKDQAKMLHILPCGNVGSFEHDLVSLVKNGIDPSRGNRFYFEEEGHLRRLKSSDLDTLWAGFDFMQKKSFFANQHFGAIDWITDRSPVFAWNLTEPSLAKDAGSRPQLRRLRLMLMGINLLRLPEIVYRKISAISKSFWPFNLLRVIAFIPRVIFMPFDLFIRGKAAKEWQAHQGDKNGSEMYLYYERI